MNPIQTVRGRLAAAFTAILVLFVVNYLAVYVVTERSVQARDVSTLTVNQALRGQRAAKEILLLAATNDASTRTSLTQTIELYDRAEGALLHGGDAQLAPGRPVVRVAPVEGELRARIAEANTEWTPLRELAMELLAAPAPSISADQLAAIAQHSSALREVLASAAEAADVQFEGIQELRRGVALSMIALSLALVSITGWYVLRRVIRPIIELSRSARILASGDLTTTIARHDGGDEVAALSNAFAVMSSNLRANLETIQGTAVNLAASSNEILVASRELAAGARQEAAATTQIAASAEEVRTTTDEATERAQEVADAARRANEVALAGQASIESIQHGMQSLRERVETIAQRILALSEQTQAIGEITSTVADLADQTNVLAVNAAIEAAKAGEHGRGFSVVAREVRNLAEGSRAATGQIRSVLSEIQKGAQGAVLVSEQGSKGVAESLILVERAGEVIDELAAAIGESADLARQIAASSKQQRIGVEQVGSGVQQIVEVSSQNAASAEQLRAEAEGVAALSNELTGLTARFNLGPAKGA